ncbi:preprotein translocase subunit SecG [Robbsia sp. Bb-Pol-6]|uniref:Protein-export membrane protein SecG n=1 Tax=Robbsia betulipollinis TaxID=2981849 RepID=A0ABT3ZMK1_9BURK|nr:preprotein translocase subunit SecG [Robbsia betulipollinis]MCY0387745.1 preprotein translocase subunit SecG [Robbsia betulipollinis]
MVLLKSLIVVIQILSALGVIGLVLVQHGKGADMGAAFGSGSSGSLFGASGSSNFLSRTTGVLAALFFICTLGLTYLGSTGRTTTSVGVMGTATAPVGAASGVMGGSSVPPTAVTPTNPVPAQDVPK